MDNNRPFYRKRIFWTVNIVIVIAFAIIIGLNFNLMRDAETNKMQSEGQLRLSNIASQVENSLSKAENYAESYSAQLEMILESGENGDDKLYSFIDYQNELLKKKTGGACTATYIAYNNKLYMQDFVPDEDFNLTERVWYVGAEKNQGNLFITNPYIDANTGELCYSISKLLEDDSTIIGMDFTMEDIQDYVEEMDYEIDGISMIINSTGMIVGHSDGSVVGRNYDELEYRELIDKVFNLYGNYFEYTIANGTKYTVFSDKTTSGWYLIVCIPTNAIKSGLNNSTIAVNIILAVLCICLLVFFSYTYAKRTRLKYKLDIQEKFLNDASLSLRKSANRIISQTNVVDELSSTGAREFIGQIRDTSRDLINSLDNLSTFGQLSRDDVEDVHKKDGRQLIDSLQHRKQGRGIVIILLIAAIVSVTINTVTQIKYVDMRMQEESEVYFSKLQSWVDTNITLTNDMALHLGAQPELYKDYEKAVEYIDNVVGNNSEISVAYIVNPKWEHTVIMNNGWEPTDPSWHVEEREWYVDTVLSDNGFNISTPYKDEQTGLYCVTFSQIVYNKAGETVGIVGVDFYMDTLIDILGKSYTNDGYAFLTDSSYTILNHPSDAYQMSSTDSVNAADTEYRNALIRGTVTTFVDYDSNHKVCYAISEPQSGFTVITVKNLWLIYSTLIISDIMLVLMFAVCIGLILAIIKYITEWQEKLNLELKNAADEAIAAGKAKSDFLANMSHEIRTPINAVLGMNEMIQREANDPVILSYAADIQSAGKNLLSIINDILDFSKIESGKMTIVPMEYDVSSVINDLVNMISSRAKNKNLKLVLDIDRNLPETLFGDDVRLCQIITNILTNAVKYTDSGSVTLTIRREYEEVIPENGDILNIYVAVRDTGRGIREEDIDKLYATFTRIDEKNTRNIEGTGLGINITSSLLRMMDSELKVESVYGKGSVFYFTIPQKVVSNRPIGDYKERFKKATSAESKDNEKRTAPNARILLVDDTEMNLKVEANLLKRTKAKIDTAVDGLGALEKMASEKYDIIFLDHMMPGMDGIETLNKAREQDIIKNTPVIALTANAVGGARERYLEAGFDDYLSKPVKGKDIEGMLYKYINKDLIEVE